MKTRIWMAVALILMASSASTWPPCPALCQEVNTGIIAPTETYGGHTYQEWNAYYIDQKIAPLYGIAPANPDFSSPDVHFLTIKQKAASEIMDTIPAGKAVMLMIADMLDNEELVFDESGDQISSIDKDVADWKKHAEQGSISCAIDGTPVQHLKEHVFKNKLAQKIRLSGENHGAYDWSMGISLLIRPLTPGIHNIHIYSHIPEYDDYTNEAIYRIEVK
jgi:hypothetical protein